MTATMTIPDTADGLAEMLRDNQRMTALFGPGANAEDRETFLTNYARVVNGRDANIAVQIREETQRQVAAMLRENGQQETNRPDLSPVDKDGMPANLPKHTVYNKAAKGAVLDKEFSGLGDYLHAVSRFGQAKAANAPRLDAIRNAFGSESPADGGFLVPEILRSQLLKVALETAVMRPRATVLPMDSRTVPFPAVDSTTNVGSVFGGITTYWTEEGAALTPSSASFGRVVLDAKKLTAYAEVPNELVRDSIIAFEAFLSQTFPQALAFSEDVKFIGGTGVGEPLGYINSPARVTVTKESGQASGTIVWENLLSMYQRMLPSSLGNAIWIASIDTFRELATMALSVGTGGGPVWMGNLQYPGSGAAPVTILGRPVHFTEKAPALGTEGDITLIDPSYYLIGDRQMMTAADSQDYKFANDLTAFRFIERLDGRPWLLNSITPANGGAPLSSIVTLQSR